MPGGSRHAPKPRGAAEGARASQTPSRRAEAGGSLDEDRIADVIQPVVAAAGMDLESVRVTAAGRRRLLRVVVDSDRGVSLDDAATVSRKLSAALDKHPKIARLIYPGRPDHPQAKVAQKQMRGGSTLVAFDIAGGKKAAFRFCDELKLVCEVAVATTWLRTGEVLGPLIESPE